jgi:hypothetical protein
MHRQVVVRMETAQGMTGEPGRSQTDFSGHFSDPL